MNEALSHAQLEFADEVIVYCRGISDADARDYAVEYARMIANRANGIETLMPTAPHGLFEPHRKLIRSTLQRMGEKHFREA